MKIRAVGLIGCFLALLMATPSLFARQEPPLACCSTKDECGTLRCCEWEFVADEPCSTVNSGYCQAACVRNTSVGEQ